MLYGKLTATALAVNDSIVNIQQQHLTPLAFDKEKIADYKKSSSFDYTENKQDSATMAFFKWLDNLWNSFWHWLLDGNEANDLLGTIMYISKYLLILLLLAFVVWLFFKVNPGKYFLSKKAKGTVMLSEDEKIMVSKNLPKLIEEAINNKNYRLAIRYYYLDVLKKLKENNFIDYQPEKTNFAYILEIEKEDLREQFQKQTEVYDFVWYGEFPVNKQLFTKVQQHYISTLKTITTHGKSL